MRTWYNYLAQTEGKQRRHEPVSNLPSMTVPDATIPMPELVARYQRNQYVTIHQPVYLDAPDTERLERLDPFEKVELKQYLQRQVDGIRGALQERVKRVVEQEKKRKATPPPQPPTPPKD